MSQLEELLEKERELAQERFRNAERRSEAIAYNRALRATNKEVEQLLAELAQLRAENVSKDNQLIVWRSVGGPKRAETVRQRALTNPPLCPHGYGWDDCPTCRH